MLGNHAGGPTHFDFGLFAAHQIDESPTAVLALEALCRADAVVENLRGLLFARNRDSNACADRVSIAFDTFEPELCGLWVAPLPCVEGVGSPGICAIHEVKDVTKNYFKFHHDRLEYVVGLNAISLQVTGAVAMCSAESAYVDMDCFESYKKKYKKVRSRLKTMAILRETQTDDDIEQAQMGFWDEGELLLLDVQCDYK